MMWQEKNHPGSALIQSDPFTVESSILRPIKDQLCYFKKATEIAVNMDTYYRKKILFQKFKSIHSVKSLT